MKIELLNIFANLLFIPITVNGVKTTAYFDTGAQMTILSESLAQIVNVTDNGSPLCFGNNNGASFQLETGTINQIVFGDRAVYDLNVGILPDKAFDLGLDQFNRPFPAEIIFGWDIISQFCWHFDFDNGTVEVQDGGTMPQGNLDWGGFLLLRTQYEGKTMVMGLDTGHTDTILDSTWLARLPQARKKDAIIQGIGGVSEETVYVVDEIAFNIYGSRVILHNIDILEHELFGAEFDDMSVLLGIDIFAEHNFILDYPSRYLSLTRRKYN